MAQGTRHYALGTRHYALYTRHYALGTRHWGLGTRVCSYIFKYLNPLHILILIEFDILVSPY